MGLRGPIPSEPSNPETSPGQGARRSYGFFYGSSAQRVRYYGWYSNKLRGVRHRGLPPDLIPHRPGVSPPSPLKLPSQKWRNLILRVWQVDPLHRPPHLLGLQFILHPSSFIL